MPVYGNASSAEPHQLSRDLPPEKRLELYEFEFENDENEAPSKKVKKRKPRVKKAETKFFANLGKNFLPPPTKPKKVSKKCIEEVVPKRVLPKRGALKQILPAENVQVTPVLSTKNVNKRTKNAIKTKESSPRSASTRGSSTRCTDQSVARNASAIVLNKPPAKKNTTKSSNCATKATSSTGCTDQSVDRNASATVVNDPPAKKNSTKSSNCATKSKESTSLSSSCHSLSKIADQSAVGDTTSNTIKQSTYDTLFGPSDSVDDQSEFSKPPSLSNSLLHQISINDFDISVAESVKSRRSSGRQSSSFDTFKIPASVTVRNLRTRSKKANTIRCSSPKNAKHIRCSSPNVSKSFDRTLLFGATSPIKRQSTPQHSLPPGDGENSLVNNLADSNTNTFNSSLRSFGNDSCVIAGHQDDTYKSTGEEDLCQYFGFDEDEEEENEESSCIPIINTYKNVTNRKAVQPKVEKVKPQEIEKPPVDEVLSLLKSSVPVDSDSPENYPEPFCLSSNIWSPVRSQVYREIEEVAEMPQISKRARPRTKPDGNDDSETIDVDSKKRQRTDELASKHESKIHMERLSQEKEDIKNPSSSKNELTHNRKGRTKAKPADLKTDEKNDEPDLEEGKKMNVYKVTKRTKGTNKQTKEKKEAAGNKKELDEYEALAASLNSQFAEIENFNLAVE